MGTFQRHLRGYSLQSFRQRFDMLKPVLVLHALDKFDDEAVALVLLVHWDIGMLAYLIFSKQIDHRCHKKWNCGHPK